MDMFNVIDGSSVCHSCQSFVGMLRKRGEDNKSKQKSRYLKIRNPLGVLHIIEYTAEKLCSLKLDKQVCLEAVQGFGPVLYKSLVDKTFDPVHFCEGIFLCPRTTHRESLKKFAEDILKDKPVTNIPTPTKKSTYNIMQIADPHIDLQYQIVF